MLKALSSSNCRLTQMSGGVNSSAVLWIWTGWRQAMNWWGVAREPQKWSLERNSRGGGWIWHVLHCCSLDTRCFPLLRLIFLNIRGSYCPNAKPMMFTHAKHRYPPLSLQKYHPLLQKDSSFLCTQPGKKRNLLFMKVLRWDNPKHQLLPQGSYASLLFQPVSATGHLHGSH